ncbi:MAG TPA: cob(I)yrinic acid a,c-diamide adenosyltransferase [Acidimicrobiales bacterium]|nr:cob(I)yrinic acid a,c-diamide adenosyltransferase [Acidimicrobiales bacterium]
MRIYTRTGDDGTTGLLFGGRVRKDHAAPTACGDVDEAQAARGMARALAMAGGGGENGASAELGALLVGLERDLWVLMAELATAPQNRPKLVPGRTLVTADMVSALESLIDDVTGRFPAPTEFVLPGQSLVSAALDLARTVVRRAERSALAAAADGSLTVPYLNRLSDLLWGLARWQEGEPLPSRPPTAPPPTED